MAPQASPHVTEEWGAITFAPAIAADSVGYSSILHAHSPAASTVSISPDDATAIPLRTKTQKLSDEAGDIRQIQKFAEAWAKS